LDRLSRLTVAGHSDDVVAELIGERLGHGAHPSSDASQRHSSDVTYPCSSPSRSSNRFALVPAGLDQVHDLRAQLCRPIERGAGPIEQSLLPKDLPLPHTPAVTNLMSHIGRWRRSTACLPTVSGVPSRAAAGMFDHV